MQYKTGRLYKVNTINTHYIYGVFSQLPLHHYYLASSNIYVKF